MPRPLPVLAREITAGAVRLAAATAAWLRLVAEFDEREGWAGHGIKSCAHWLAWQCGLGPGAAREHVRVARALRRLPSIEAAFAEGRLSYSKVRALTRVAEPDTEASLLDVALQATASQTERIVRGWRRVDRVDADTLAGRQQFDHWWDDDGMFVLKVRMPAEEGAELLAAVESLAERSARRERAEATRRTATGTPALEQDGPEVDPDDEVELARERTTARRCAALGRLAAAAVHADRRPGDPPRREVVLHVDAAVLAEDAAAGRAYLEGGPAVHPKDARRMLCEATALVMLEQGREVLAMGRRRRLATRSQRRALLRRDGGCARPGCPETRIERLHAHHMRHWLHGGRTDLTNLVLLCDADHGLVHDLDLVMTRREGQLVVTAPEGRRVWGRADAAFSDGLSRAEAAGDDGRERGPAQDDTFVGVHPIDERTGRRPQRRRRGGDARNAGGDGRNLGGDAQHAGGDARNAGRPERSGRRSPRFSGAPDRRRPGSARRHGAPPSRRLPRAARSRATASVGATSVGAVLFPHGEPPLPDAMPANGERMDLHWAIAVLMGNRDVARRLAAESAGAVG